MNNVNYRSLVRYSTFQKVPTGGIYYLSNGRTGPFVKTATRRRLRTSADSQEDVNAQVDVDDTSAGVIRVDRYFTHS